MVDERSAEDVLLEDSVAELMVVLRLMTVPVAAEAPPDATRPVPAAMKRVVVAEAVVFVRIATVALREAIALLREVMGTTAAGVMREEMEEAEDEELEEVDVELEPPERLNWPE